MLCIHALYTPMSLTIHLIARFTR